MKTKKLFVFILLAAVVLSACGAENLGDSSSTQTGSDIANQEQFEGEGLNVNQILLGVLVIDDGDQALNAQQASTLLPYFRLLKTLAESDTAAQAELDAVINQIQNALTPEQIEAILNLDFTPEETSAIYEELGIAQEGGRGSFTLDEDGERPEGAPSGGGGGGGGMGGGMGGGGGDPSTTDFSPEEIATLQAERAERQSSGVGFVNIALLDAVIEFLEGK